MGSTAFLFFSLILYIETCHCWIFPGMKVPTHRGFLQLKTQVQQKSFKTKQLYRTSSNSLKLSSKSSDDSRRPIEGEFDNRTIASRALFSFSDWGQFLPGNLSSTDDAAAAGVLGMMMRAIDAGKQANQDSSVQDGNVTEVCLKHPMHTEEDSSYRASAPSRRR